MDRDPEEHSEREDRDGVVDKLLTDLGVDNDMRKELMDSGRMSGDVLKVASADQVRRRMEIDKGLERLRDSMNLLERNITQIENAIDRIERDLIPVVLSFLVGLKGDLVNLRTTVIARSKRRAKTNLQAQFVETEVKSIVTDEFSTIEETLTSGMSAPILEKIREITDGFRAVVKLGMDEISTLKAGVDDFSQRTSTELEFLTKELGMKPKVEVPREVAQQLKDLTRKCEELQQQLSLSAQKLENREAEIIALQSNLAATKARNESLEEALETARTTPSVDAEVLGELRQEIRTLETTKAVLDKKLADSDNLLEINEERMAHLREDLAKKELEAEDYRRRATASEEEISKMKDRLLEVDELKARVRSLESGDTMRELERVRSEMERASGSLSRLTNDHAAMKTKLEFTEKKLAGYLGLMQSSEKTKAFLMVEESGELSIKEIGRSLGVSAASVSKWAEDFERLGIARIVDGTKLVLTLKEQTDQ
jgi:predicted  nucleic acid-binding Zn-ribbon protein